jgi:cytochrome oxidase Cu insertion factor (SCO1/SenC/PrrC family)
MRRLISLLLPALLALAATLAAAEIAPPPATRAEARLEGRAVPDIPLRLADGHERMLSDLSQGQALLVTFFYRRCAGVCMPFLEWINNATTEVGGLGSDYQVLALSFDEADTVADLRAQARIFGLLENRNWHFAVTDQAALADITGALDFWYRRQGSSNQYDHGSLLVAVRDGRVIRALSGGPGQTQRLRELVWELRGRVASYYAVDKEPMLRCLDFDPRTGALRLDWGMLLLVAPALTSLAAAMTVFRPRRHRPSLLQPKP